MSLNKVILIGRIANNLEIKSTQSGTHVLSFTIAIDRRLPQGQEKTADFIKCVAWKQSADFLSKYGSKGSLVSVEGRLQTRTFDSSDGKKNYVTEVVCESVNILKNPEKKEEQTEDKPEDKPEEQTTEDSEDEHKKLPF